MSGRINSQPLGVKTLFDALDITVDINVTGNNSGVGLSQWYYQNKELAPGETDADRYSPNRYGTGGEPITLHPVIKAVDPATRSAVTPAIQTVTWTEIASNGTRTPITNTTDGATALYVVKPDGSLLVKKNVPYNAQVSIECVILWTDPRNSEPHNDTKVVNLKTNLEADETWRIEIEKPSQRWNPLSGSSSTFTVKARALNGKTDKSSDVTFIWKYMHNLGTASSPNWVEKKVEDSDYPCLAYVSGQGTNTITVNAEYETETLTLVCHIGTGSPVTEVANVKAYASVIWSLPQAEGNTYSPNGDTARSTIPTMTFKTMVQAGGTNVSEAILRSRTRTHWKAKRDSAGASAQDWGWGFEVTRKNTELIASDKSRIVITPEIYILSPYKLITQDSKVLYYDDNGTRKYIVEKVID